MSVGLSSQAQTTIEGREVWRTPKAMYEWQTNKEDGKKFCNIIIYMYFFSGSSLSSPSIVFSYLPKVVRRLPLGMDRDLHCKHYTSTHDQPC